MTEDIELGDIAEDTISGYEGVVTAIAYHLTGCTRIEISAYESPSADSQFFYEEQLETHGESEYDHEIVTDTEFELGENVRDDVTGFEGYIVTITYELYNCPSVGVQSDSDEKDTEWFDVPRVSKLDNGVRENFTELSEKSGGETGAASTDIVRKPVR